MANNNQDKSNNKIVKSSSSLLSTISDNKTAMMVIGGLSIGVLAYKMYKLLPAPHPSVPMAPGLHPILGHAPFFQNNFNKIHDKLFELIKNDEIIAVKLPGVYEIFLNTPQLIEWVFTTEFKKFFKGPSRAEQVEDLFGKYGQGIFVSDDDKWRFHRKIGSRMFSVRNLRDYMYNCCIDTTDITLNILNKLNNNNQIIDICDILGRMTFDCFTSIAFGKSFDSMSSYPVAHPFGAAFDVLVSLLTNRFSDPFWKIKRFLNIDYEKEIAKNFKVIYEFSDDLITSKKLIASKNQNITDETGKNTFDLFSLYYNNNKKLTNNDMKYIAFNFIIAGRDTTRMLTSWFLYDLTQFKHVKCKVIKEIDEYKNDHPDGINYYDIRTKFKYLEAALCETLRYHPVVPFSTRTARQDIVIPKHIHPGGYLIKKDDLVAIHQFTICKLDRFYADPMVYNPLRFYEKGVKTFKQNVFPFFNQKPRLCLGRDFALMEAKIFLYNFLKEYDYSLIPNQDITYSPGFIFNMKNGLKITIKKRN